MILQIDSEIIYPKSITNNNNALVAAPNDPLYVQQTNITATNIDDVWEQYTTGDNSQTIAILDTGVDYTHPDLEANIWINEAELNGVAGFDDDGNGYIDDIRGWDFINLDNTPLDDNMHGTHVAGIAGAVGDNGIGIAGAAWNVKLMPIKVFQASGSGSSTTISKELNMPNNGATILNMSFGSFARINDYEKRIRKCIFISLYLLLPREIIGLIGLVWAVLPFTLQLILLLLELRTVAGSMIITIKMGHYFQGILAYLIMN